VRTDRLEAAVWQEVRRLLEQPQRLEQEYRRRLEVPPPDASAADLTATVSQLMTNIDLPAAAFTIEIPAEAQTITVDDLQRRGELRQR